MKRTIVKIKSNLKKDDIFCEVNGRAGELMGAYMALTENLVQSFKKEGKFGIQALRMIRKDVEEIFDEAEIFIENNKEEQKIND